MDGEHMFVLLLQTENPWLVFNTLMLLPLLQFTTHLTHRNRASSDTLLMEVFFTKEKLIHSGVVEDTICPWCTEEDSAMHRHWHCLEAAEYRAQLPEQLLADFDTLPECTKQHGWITKPDNMKGYLDMLVALPDRSQQFHEVQVQFPVAHLFTDGSACNPTDRIFRVATWGVDGGSGCSLAG